MKKKVWWNFVEHARTMVFTVREAHGEVSGSVLEPLFFAIAARRALRRVLQRCANELFAIFEDSRGSLGNHFSIKNPICFRV